MQLFAIHIMPLNEFLGVMMLFAFVAVFYSRRYLNNNPEVKDTAKSVAKSKIINLLTKFIK